MEKEEIKIHKADLVLLVNTPVSISKNLSEGFPAAASSRRMSYSNLDYLLLIICVLLISSQNIFGSATYTKRALSRLGIYTLRD